MMAGRIEPVLDGQNLRGNVGKQRRRRCFRIDVEGCQVMQGSVAIYPAEGSTARLSGGFPNRRNVETAFGADSQWSAYPWLDLSEARETSRSMSYPDTSGNTVLEACVV